MIVTEVALDLTDFRWWQTFDELPGMERSLNGEFNTVEWRYYADKKLPENSHQPEAQGLLHPDEQVNMHPPEKSTGKKTEEGRGFIQGEVISTFESRLERIFHGRDHSL